MYNLTIRLPEYDSWVIRKFLSVLCSQKSGKQLLDLTVILSSTTYVRKSRSALYDR